MKAFLAMDTRGPRLGTLRGAGTNRVFFGRATPAQKNHRGGLCPAKSGKKVFKKMSGEVERVIRALIRRMKEKNKGN